MKILLVDMAITGHRLQYIKALMSCCGAEFVLVAPEQMDLDCRQHTLAVETGSGRTFAGYRRWMSSIRKIVKQEKPDLVHFLYGDGLYKYFGWGVSGIPCRKKITTLHMVRSGAVQEMSLKVLSRRFQSVIVHSEYLWENLNQLGIRNAVHVEYPHFNVVREATGTEKTFFGLDGDRKTILCLGGTRRDKGLDILLEALRDVRSPFQLLVAGREMDFDEAYIREHSQTYRDSVFLALRYLSDEEIDKALIAADIVCLPYRGWFNGASGPLGEGVSYGKCIVGPDHGNLGITIRNNHLGFVFEAESPSGLAKVLEQALAETFVPDDKYREYQNTIDVRSFQKKYSEIYTGGEE